MSVAVLNKSAVQEVKNNFYLTCNANQLSSRDLLVLVLEPLVHNRSVSAVVDEILEKGLPYLASLSEFELSVLFGLNEKQGFHLMSVFELARRLNGVRREDETVIRSPQDMARICSDLKSLDKEHFVTVYLDTKNKVTGRETISVGSLNAAIVHPREGAPRSA